MSKLFDVAVFGSCMIDLVCYTPRLAKVGETIHGSDFQMGHGGKGANQCVAAAKLGASAALVARLGNDSFGRTYKEYLSSLGINTDHVVLTDNTTSGMAQITVSEKGENQIVIVAGANNKMSFEDARRAEDVLMSSKVVVFQFETPIEVTIETLRFIKREGGPFTIVNGAPSLSNLDPQIFKLCDIFCVNESEAEDITKMPVKSVADAIEASKELQTFGCSTVIITLGGAGAVYAEADSEPQHVPVREVIPVDTTGAGDAFIGALAYVTAACPEANLKDRIKRSCLVASHSVVKKGTQLSFPTIADLGGNKCFLPEGF